MANPAGGQEGRKKDKTKEEEDEEEIVGRGKLSGKKKKPLKGIDTTKYFLDEPPVQKAELMSLFKSYDVDNGGRISSGEMLTLMQKRKRSLGVFIVTESDCNVIMNALDKDKSGGIGIEEFAEWILSGLNRTPEERSDWSIQSTTTKRLDMFLATVHKDVLDHRS